ncbi:MAG: glycoside hydrolase family 5 protein [Alistipes sp.]|nr:glycoside hydrolase family 5 protein [Alistipes sp.]
MKRLIYTIVAIAALSSCISDSQKSTETNADQFVRIDGTDLLRPDGEKLFIKGTNLGNWLNPEGYMFGFRRTNSPHMIDLMLRQAVGPDFTDAFWQKFKDNYITRDDIGLIASTGANTIRLPFNYRMFTDEDYMGLKSSHDGFERIDRLVEWCRDFSYTHLTLPTN